MTNLNDKVLLISGAGWEPGRSTALALAEQGAQVLLCDLTPVNLDPIAAEITALGSKTEIYTADISGKIPAQTMVTNIVEAWERIDILVNIIGVNPQRPLLELDEWDWRRALDVNLTGSFLMTQIVGRVMREIGGGKILSVASIIGEPKPGASEAAFATGRAGLIGLTHSAARELAPHNIQVNALFQETTGAPLPLALPSPQAQELVSGAETLAEAAVLLCSPAADGISGQVIVIPK